jgi:hypothetical protein
VSFGASAMKWFGMVVELSDIAQSVRPGFPDRSLAPRAVESSRRWPDVGSVVHRLTHPQLFCCRKETKYHVNHADPPCSVSCILASSQCISLHTSPPCDSGRVRESLNTCCISIQVGPNAQFVPRRSCATMHASRRSDCSKKAEA